MKYMRQFGIILGVTLAGELLRYFLPLPIPGSIYGLILMFGLLMSGVIRYEQVKETGDFLIEVMPVMFIPAGVGLMDAWSVLRPALVPVCVITVMTTFAVMFVTGKTADFLVAWRSRGEQTGAAGKEAEIHE